MEHSITTMRILNPVETLPACHMKPQEEETSKLVETLAGDFDKRVQGLPSELYLIVYEEVFTAAPTYPYLVINQYYRPPKLMRIHRKSRDRFARSYYAKNTFRIRDCHTCKSWIFSIAPQYVSCISQVRYANAWVSDRGGGFADAMCAGFAASDRNMLIRFMSDGEEKSRIVDSVRAALRVGVQFYGDEAVVWTADAPGALLAKEDREREEDAYDAESKDLEIIMEQQCFLQSTTDHLVDWSLGSSGPSLI
ncbi:hypothetical protein Tdes44962_MAKER06931 [Teratosphaeria destructans]|uniref:Uncharacterized protein n=1 Tax=Teratosphaeria destructans TaxID=418781 RepID=A0A9W7T0F9_9PEZI|nr:hypothetical protein Tdes44962_MAKER06931 [Teratosphaeria destructans]